MFSLGLSSFLIIASSFQPSEIDRLIQQLGSPQFAERQAASKGLEAIGEPAVEALQKAVASSPDAEVRRRAETLLATIKAKRAAPAPAQPGPQAGPGVPILQNAIDKALADRWRTAYALWRKDTRRGPETLKVFQEVSEVWLKRLPQLPAALFAEETAALLSATLEIVDAKPKPAS
jgi:hypothetical protein